MVFTASVTTLLPFVGGTAVPAEGLGPPDVPINLGAPAIPLEAKKIVKQKKRKLYPAPTRHQPKRHCS